MKPVTRITWAHVCFWGYVILTAFTALHHEPWRDEAQAWLIVRDLPLDKLFAQANYEGTPLLWHLILFPFAKSGAPYCTLQLIHLLIAYGIVYLFLFKSNFSSLTKGLFVFSYYMLWEYAIVARNYNLSILIVFGLAVLYQQKLSRPLWYASLIFLLFNTNVHSIPLALGLSLVFVYEMICEKRMPAAYVYAGMIMCAGLVVATLQLIPAPDNINRDLFYIFSWKRPFIAAANAFFPHVPGVGYVTVILASLLLVLQSAAIFVKKRSAGVILAITYAGMAYIFIFRHTGSLRHHGLILITLLFVVWVVSAEKAKPIKWLDNVNTLSINICLFVSIAFSVQYHYWEYKHLFSGAEQAAGFIDKHLKEGEVLVAHPSINASAIAPYLQGVPFWYADVASFGTFITWNSAYEAGKEITSSAAIQLAEDTFGGTENELFIFAEPVSGDTADQLRLVYQTEGNVFGYGEERYFIYRRE